MAVVATPVSSTLQVSVQVGTDSYGRPQLKKLSFSGLKASLTDQQIFDLATVLGGLQQYPVTANQRANQVELANG
ncbi:MAG: DUF1659 domain-containing protein [Peptococcaceae bacterium]|nr:DUF1659 domain-containing protein [Peptococcaceae bacterium]